MNARRVLRTLAVLAIGLGLSLSLWPWDLPIAEAQENAPSNFFTMSDLRSGYNAQDKVVEISWKIKINQSSHIFQGALFEVTVDGKKISEIYRPSPGSAITSRNVANEKGYRYDGSLTVSNANPASVTDIAIFSPTVDVSFKTSVATFTLIDKKSPQIKPGGTVSYSIKPLYAVFELEASAGFKPYYGPTISRSVDLSRDSGIVGGRDKNWYAENYFSDRGSFRLKIDCGSDKSVPPTITIPGKNLSGGKQRPQIVFTLKAVIRARGGLRDQNKFYFIGGRDAPNLGIVVTDFLGSSVLQLQERGEQYYIATVSPPNADDTGNEIPGVTMVITDELMRSFENCILNKYYNDYESDTDRCIPGTVGKTDYKVGEVQSKCLSVESLPDSVITNRSTFTDPTGVSSEGGPDPCANVGKGLLGFIGKAICSAGLALAGGAAYFAQISFNWLLSAADLQ